MKKKFQMENKSKNTIDLILIAFVYFFIVSGGFIPTFHEDFEKSLGKLLALIMLIFGGMLVSVRINTLKVVGVFILCGIFFAILSMTRSNYIVYAIEKLDGAILCTAGIVLFLDYIFIKIGRDNFLKNFNIIALVILILTIFYKIHFGFFTRDVRFFLNGPIVFSWIMSFCALSSFHLWLKYRGNHDGLFFLVFIIAVFWTESKGALVAFSLSFIFYCLFSVKEKRIFLLFLISFLSFIAFLLLKYFTVEFEESRFGAIARLFTGNLDSRDEGSIGIREELMGHAMDLFFDNPFIGIGLGNYQFDEFFYPHNQHLELFAEMGFFIGSLSFCFILYAFFKSDLFFKCVIMLFVIAGSFSGDASYLRFTYSFAILGILNCKQISKWNN
ncbi:MAG: O-antigen ligase family protein [Comamonas sp.]